MTKFAKKPNPETDLIPKANPRASEFQQVVPPKTFDPRGKYPKPGKRICRWCHEPIKDKRRRDYCGSACQISRLAWSSWGDTRRYVFWRDGGVCKFCGIDCFWVERIMEKLKPLGEQVRWQVRVQHRGPYPRSAFPDRVYRYESVTKGSRGGFMFAEHVGWRRYDSSFWEIDHIKPKHEGGHDQPPNLRTLCQRCHSANTARYAGELAAGRRRDGQLKLPMNGRTKIPSHPFPKVRRKLRGRPFRIDVKRKLR